MTGTKAMKCATLFGKVLQRPDGSGIELFVTIRLAASATCGTDGPADDDEDTWSRRWERSRRDNQVTGCTNADTVVV